MKQTPTRVDSSGMSWTTVLDLLFQQRPIPSFTKFNGAVVLSRAWDSRLRRGVWSKTYRNGFELAAFNEWEFDILKRLAQFKVPHTYRAVLLEREGTSLAASLDSKGDAGAQITIKTEHEGPTLADLCRMPTRARGEILAHFFSNPIQYLRLTRALLVALEAIHRNHFVHCDVHAGNIAIPVADLSKEGSGSTPSRVCCELRVDKLKLIDFGFSIDRRSPPYTTLPFLRSGYGRKISKKFANLLEEVDRLAQGCLKPTDQWGSAMLDPIFWRHLDPNPLHMLCQINFKEDLFQLGVMMADLRDGRGEFSDLCGGTINAKPGSQLGLIIGTLPETLKNFGTSATKVIQSQLPHSVWIAEIDKVLRHAGEISGADNFDLLDLNQQDFGCGLSKNMLSQNETRIQHVQKIQLKPIEQQIIQNESRKQKKERSTQSEISVADVIKENNGRGPAINELIADKPVSKIYSQTGGLASQTTKVPAALLLSVALAICGVVIFALATKDAGVVHLVATPTLQFAAASGESVDTKPQQTQAQIEEKAKLLAQHLGINVVSEYYSGGRSVEVKLLGFEHARSPAYTLNVEINWRGNILGQDGYGAKGVITVLTAEDTNPILGKDANWNPSWVSDRLSAWLAAKGAAKQWMARPQQ